MNFVMVAGIPGSDKETLISQLTTDNTNIVVLDAAVIRKQYCANRFTQQANLQVFSLMNQQAYDALANGKSVIYNADNLSKARRMTVLDIISSQNPTTICYAFNTPVDTAIERIQERENRKIDKTIIQNFAKQWEVPTTDEGWDEIIIKDN